MESETTTKIRELTLAFITELNRQNLPTEEFSCLGLGAACEGGDLQRVEITATAIGWDLYSRFKELWIAD